MRLIPVAAVLFATTSAGIMGCGVEIPAKTWNYAITYTGPNDAGRSQFCSNMNDDFSWDCTDWVPGNFVQWKGWLSESRLGLDACPAQAQRRACGYAFNIEFDPWPHFAVTQERGALFSVGHLDIERPFPTDLLLVDNGLGGGNFALKVPSDSPWAPHVTALTAEEADDPSSEP
ncbi:hypothetical protein HY632_00195 [Candidatus Uhrbacteria bacterium]|nr:hypothetical protein [Candidatus Uhrbacteria bacterium]